MLCFTAKFLYWFKLKDLRHYIHSSSDMRRPTIQSLLYLSRRTRTASKVPINVRNPQRLVHLDLSKLEAIICISSREKYHAGECNQRRLLSVVSERPYHQRCLPLASHLLTYHSAWNALQSFGPSILSLLASLLRTTKPERRSGAFRPICTHTD